MCARPANHCVALFLSFLAASPATLAASWFIRFDLPTPETFIEYDGVTAFALETDSFPLGTQSASADLTTGTLGALAMSNRFDLCGFSCAAIGTAWFGDTLTFDNVVAPFEVTFTFAVHGVTTGDAANNQATLIAGETLLGSVFAQDLAFYGLGVVDDLLTITVMITPARPSFAVWALVQAGVTGPSGTADFSNTQLAINAPDGVTWTSASGVLLCETPQHRVLPNGKVVWYTNGGTCHPRVQYPPLRL